MDKVLVITPTYNEINNIAKLIPMLKEMYPEINILIVDDGSPDGTGQYVEDLSKTDSTIHIIRRPGKMGLGTAYVEGFKYAIKNKFDLIIQMDADFSHDPKVIKTFLEKAKEYDLIIGSRYVSGVNVVNWPMKRLLLSYFANKYTKIITGLPIQDATGGYKCFRREVLENIDLSRIHSNGYSFQIEINFKAWKKKFKLHEVPIIFADRIEGSSKMSKKIVYEAVFMVWKLRIRSLLGLLK